MFQLLPLSLLCSCFHFVVFQRYYFYMYLHSFNNSHFIIGGTNYWLCSLTSSNRFNVDFAAHIVSAPPPPSPSYQIFFCGCLLSFNITLFLRHSMIDEAALMMHSVLVALPETARNSTPGVFVVLHPLVHVSL